ncbi:MAG: NAD(P)-dependent oxidoreductase [Proteobacteria bacterium]|nr:NAD(P)-dependent oxidoreductase [Pseudomonadota bacterium]
MRIVITGSAGNLGKALVRRFSERGCDVVGIDVLHSPYTNNVGSILDRDLINKLFESADVVLHAATLHKPHVATHSVQKFIDVNITGTQILLEAAVKHRVKAFIFTSTTSTFGHAMLPEESGQAVWVTENLRPVPKNIYGVTKVAAEDLCQLVHQEHGLPCLVLKTSRFFPEEDDMKHTMPGYSQDNIKAIEFLNRRVDIEDVVTAHELAIERAADLKFDKFIISATSPFAKEDCSSLLKDAPSVLRTYHPDYEQVFDRQGWKMFPSLGRVYVNQRAREKLGWEPKYNFGDVLRRLRLKADQRVLSDLALQIGAKGYHRQAKRV